jgi:hypothetical protein
MRSDDYNEPNVSTGPERPGAKSEPGRRPAQTAGRRWSIPAQPQTIRIRTAWSASRIAKVRRKTSYARAARPRQVPDLVEGGGSTSAAAARPAVEQGAGEPIQIALISSPRLALTGEEGVGLMQDQDVRAPAAPGLVINGQLA